MISAVYYQLIYILLVTVLTLFEFFRYKDKKYFPLHNGRNYCDSNRMGALLLTLFLIVFVGTRPNSVKYFTDTANYYEYYNVLYRFSHFKFDFNAENLIFDNLLAYWGSADIGMRSFVFLITLVYFGCAFLAIKRLFKNNVLAAYLVFLAAFSTFSYATNGIKAGAAASVFLLALSFWNKKYICILLAFVSIGLHHSMQLPVGALILSLFYKNSKTYLGIWLICTFLSAINISFFSELFAGLTDEKGKSYLIPSENDWGGKTGFRLDFIIYSAMPVLVGYWTIYKKKMKLSVIYTSIFNIYLITNSVWMLCMYASYTNRIAYLSWFLYPVILIYPFLNEQWGTKKYVAFSKIMLAHLCFTLFMFFIYY